MIVRVSYPPGKVRETIVGGIVPCCMVAVAAISASRMFGWRVANGSLLVLLIFPGVFAAMLLPLVLVRALGLAKSYLFEADSDGITIHTYRGRREARVRLPRDEITDVRIGFGSARRGSPAWQIIAVNPAFRWNRRLLHDLGGDELARVADALRAGIGLPPRSWP